MSSSRFYIVNVECIDDIERLFKKATGPLSVANIVKQGIPRMSAYRGVRYLLDEGIIRLVNPSLHSKAKLLYERADTEPHAHFHCRKCKKVFCILAVGAPKIPAGYKVDSWATMIEGVCKGCRC